METAAPNTDRYARVIEVSKRVRWEIERDVVRGRRFDYAKRFMPDGLSLVNELAFLTPAQRRLMSQVQGRTYAYLFGLVERFISAKVLDISREHWFGDQVALEAIVRMGDEEIKHQELFRRLEMQMQKDMPAGYVQTASPNDVAKVVLGNSTWAVMALTLDIELFVLAHYRASIDPQEDLSPLWKDVFLFHAKEEAQHAILDEMELIREDAKLDREQRSAAVDQLIGLVGAVDGILQGQAESDARYFLQVCGTPFTSEQREQVEAKFLKAYRWQFLVSGVMEPRFQKVLFGLIDEEQGMRIKNAIAPLTYALPDQPDTPLPLAA
ncbi:hypothetical protein GCM10027034_13950 [Ramlibacter solisilvae]|uniref:Ferritin-like domain-containing protein n=1 Tax=Ramlibacter tataouinensis TaxID=94132 RepID=A0A127JWW0_9BURK|nr:hypothetical protein [Ramlibacter tataouinensis]AMO24369.1 hypothetical protein UC35_17850 [Ramlibacter tataouinensis]